MHSMYELYDNEQAEKKALLIGIRDASIDAAEAESLSRELAELAQTVGVSILDSRIVSIREKNPKYGMGSGKAQELAALSRDLKADFILFDQDISPAQQRNWEELCGISVVDRQEVIIQIFAARAKTKEAELQIELAQLKHSLPRLTHKYIDLSRQRGGRYGTKGSGETRLETDRRSIQRRIHQLQEDLKVVRKNRSTQRKKRDRIPIPSCALVGYTNAGKSSLLNAMTNANALVEDKLFATLDPTTRRLELGKGQPVLLTDTVGFIRRLPHDLVDAFRSTLEEAAQATILIQVLDISDPDIDRHFETTMSVLKDLGAEHTPIINVLNKIDAAKDPQILQQLSVKYDAVALSAISGQGLDILAKRIETYLTAAVHILRIPVNRHDLVALLHRNANVLSERYDEHYIEIEARMNERVSGSLAEYIYKETSEN